jgi:hypothetical protein
MVESNTIGDGGGLVKVELVEQVVGSAGAALAERMGGGTRGSKVGRWGMCSIGKEDSALAVDGDSVGIVNGSAALIAELTNEDEGSGGQRGEDVS